MKKVTTATDVDRQILHVRSSAKRSISWRSLTKKNNNYDLIFLIFKNKHLNRHHQAKGAVGVLKARAPNWMVVRLRKLFALPSKKRDSMNQHLEDCCT